MYDVPVDLLLLRQNSDFRADVIVKEEMLHAVEQWCHVVEAIDDREELLQLWRNAEIPSVVDAESL